MELKGESIIDTSHSRTHLVSVWPPPLHFLPLPWSWVTLPAVKEKEGKKERKTEEKRIMLAIYYHFYSPNLFFRPSENYMIVVFSCNTQQYLMHNTFRCKKYW